MKESCSQSWINPFLLGESIKFMSSKLCSLTNGSLFLTMDLKSSIKRETDLWSSDVTSCLSVYCESLHKRLGVCSIFVCFVFWGSWRMTDESIVG